MKIIVFLVFIAIFQVKAKSHAQKVSLSENNASIQKVFSAIKKQTGYNFLYDGHIVKNANPVNIHVENVELTDALDLFFSHQPFTYEILNNTIVVKAKPKVAFFSKENLPPANIRGTVINSQGEPLIGVSVFAKGTKTGVTTDAQGQFSLHIPDDNGTLVFSYIGFVTQEVAVGGRNTLQVSLVEDVGSLDEVVVIGYGTTNKRDLTGSVSSVTASQIENVPVTTIEQSLQGRSAGVQVTSSNASPGADISVKIRGVGSFGNTSPLYVVDGYPITGGLSGINPADIQSMDILKDASAAAIYGNRASNGVVIITTKRGSNIGGVRISFDANTSVQLQPERYSMMNAEQFITEARKVTQTDNYPSLKEWLDNDPSSFRNIDWQDAFYRTGLRQNYNIALRGGGEKVQSSFSLGYFDQKGVVHFSSFKRYNASLNLDYTPYNWFKVMTSVKYDNRNRDSRATSLQSFLFLIPTMTGRPGMDQIEENGIYGYYTLGQKATQSNQTNLFADLQQRITDNPNDNLLTTAAFEATILPGLKAKTNLGVNTRSNSSITFNPGNDRSLNAPLSNYSQNVATSAEWLWENTLSYRKQFGEHAIDVVGGLSAQENKYRTSGVSGNGSVSNDVLNASNGNLTTINSTTGYTEYWSLASQFGRVNYKYANKYILAGSIRRDGSSRFGPGKKWGVFPTASASWIVKEEGFLKEVDAISDLKVRASWGKAGNQDVPLFAYQGPYTPGPSANDNRGYVFGTTKTYNPGLVLNALPNSNLTWETNTQSNIGIDASFLNNRFSVTADYYKRVSSDFLLNVAVPAQTGFTTAQRNVGEMQNEGLELAVQYRNYDRPFKWSVGANGSTIKNRINSYAEGLTQMYNVDQLGFRNYGSNQWIQYALSKVGGTIGAFYGYKSNGIFQDKSEIDALNAAAVAKYGPGSYYIVSSTSPGDRNFVDLNKDGRITDDDRTIIGNPLPKFFGGINFDGEYKQFDFSVFLYASIGNDVLNYARRNLENFDAAAGVGLQNFGTDFYNNHWTPENRSTTYTRLVSYDQSGNNRVSDAYIEDGSYARLKNVQIGYTLPESVAKSIYTSRLRLYVSAQNLFTITSYSGLDPEVGNGVDQGNYPTSKSFTFGLNVSF